MKMRFLYLLALLFIGFNACEKEETTNTGDRDDATINLTGSLEISDFVWQGLNQFYYWQEAVPNLADTKDDNTTSYAQFIQSNPEPDAFFETLLHDDDRFSWIVDDYVELENSLSGIEASNGVEFILLLQCQGCPGVVGFVTYILEGSDASNKDIQRGDLFIGVNGTPLTVNNYRSLLFSENLEYTLNMGEIQGDDFVLNGTDVALVKEENFQTNPIQINRVLDIDGQKVGYLMYNQFVGTFDEQLNTVFGEFKAAGVTDLILDLRYNPGGSIASCIYLASMIAGDRGSAVFSKEQWNSKLMAYWQEENPSRLTDRLTAVMEGGIAINSLNLDRLYVLTTSRSASASELLINGLKPHIEVIQIGDTTVGKNVGSITVYDYIDNSGNKNPNHKYAMQPIVLKIANSEGFSDYTDGLVPDIMLRESFSNAGILGDEQEPLLKRALDELRGTATAKGEFPTLYPIENTLITPKEQLSQRMFVKPIGQKTNQR